MRSLRSDLLAVACLLAIAALASADSCNPPAGTTCPPNSEYKVTGRGRTKTGSCVTCPAGSYTPKQGSCCKFCDGIIFTDPITNVTTCTKCPEKSSLFPRPSPRPRQPASTCMCSAGYQATGTSTLTGVTGCVKCPAGTFNAAATSSPEACQACPENSVAPKSGSKSCTACKNNSTATEDAKYCVCPVNYYVKMGRSKSRSRVGSRRLLDGDDDYKAPSCLQCASATQNSQQNTWPVCCEADQVYNKLTQKCVAEVCYDGATLVNGECLCRTAAGGIAAMYENSECSCYDSATWSNTTQTCTCSGGADYNMPLDTNYQPNCQCADGASWTGSGCDCGTFNVLWNAAQKKCICPGGLTWDAENGCTGCPTDATWSSTYGACVCPNSQIWDATFNTCG